MSPTATKILHTVTLTPMTCPVCGVVYGLSEEFRRRAQDEGHETWGWYCTNGHSLCYPGKSAEEKRADSLQRRLDMTQSALHAETLARETAERSRNALKGEVTKAKNRAAKGVCPVPECKRSFVNVARHVANQHPDFDPDTHDCDT